MKRGRVNEVDMALVEGGFGNLIEGSEREEGRQRNRVRERKVQ